MPHTTDQNPPADRAALRELVVEALRYWVHPTDRGTAADAVLAAVVPEPTDQAAVRAAALREAADFVGNDDDCDCGGCDSCVPNKLAAELRRMAAEEQPAETQNGGRAALRDQIAEALMRWAERNNSSQYASMRRPETVRQNAYSRADAVLAVLSASATCGAREPEPRTGTSPCVLPSEHGGAKHQDKWTNQWPAVGEQPETQETRPCRTFVSGGTVWCCEEGETDCPCVCHQPTAEPQQDREQPC